MADFSNVNNASNFTYRDNLKIIATNSFKVKDTSSFTYDKKKVQKFIKTSVVDNQKLRKATKDYYENAGSMVMRIFAIFMAVMLVLMLIRFTQGGTVPTITSLFEKLSNTPVQTISFFNTSTVALGDWGSLLNPIRDFFRLFLDIINVGIFFCNGILSVLHYVVWFAQWLFSV